MSERDEHDDRDEPKLEESEKVLRFGCGAILGFFVGVFFIVKWAVVSFGAAAGILVLAILVCGYLTLKYGRDFWNDPF